MTTTAADEEETEPPASVLTRRRALVPPKIPPYNMDSSEDAEPSADKETSTRSDIYAFLMQSFLSYYVCIDSLLDAWRLAKESCRLRIQWLIVHRQMKLSPIIWKLLSNESKNYELWPAPLRNPFVNATH